MKQVKIEYTTRHFIEVVMIDTDLTQSGFNYILMMYQLGPS